MVKFLIPQADSVSPVLIKASHWEKYLGDILTNYILTGLGLSAGTGLNVNVASGRGYIGGIDFESDATEAVAVVANDTNYIYAQLTRDGNNEPNGWQFVVNQTGVAPSDSILLGTATTDGSGVTGTDVTGTQQGLTLKAFSAGGDITLGDKKLKTTNLLIKQENTTTISIRDSVDSAYKGLRLENLQTANILSQIGGNAAITISGSGAMNFNGRDVSNLRLGNNMNAGFKNIHNLQALQFAASDGSVTRGRITADVDFPNEFAIMGRGTAADRNSITFYTRDNSDVDTKRLGISAGAAQATITVSNADLSIGANKILGSDAALWNQSLRAFMVQSRTNDAVSEFRLAPLGTPISGQTRIRIFDTDVVADGTNWESLDIAATLTGYSININKNGTGSLQPFKLQMGANDILTIATDLSVDHHNRLQNNFVLGNTMSANAQNIANARQIYSGSVSDSIFIRAGGLSNGTGAVIVLDGNSSINPLTLYTPNLAKSGNVVRLRFAGNADQGDGLITSFEPFQFESFQDLKVISAPGDPAAGYVRLYPKALDADNDRLYVKLKKDTAITEIDLLPVRYFAGDVSLQSDNTEAQSSNTTYTEMKDMFVGIIGGEFRVKFDLKSSLAGETAFGRIFKNGVAYGTEQTTTSDTYSTFSEDLTFEDGDEISLRVKTTDGTYTSDVRNFSVSAHNSGTGIALSPP